MKRTVRSPGSATIINAIATGFGSALDWISYVKPNLSKVELNVLMMLTQTIH